MGGVGAGKCQGLLVQGQNFRQGSWGRRGFNLIAALQVGGGVAHIGSWTWGGKSLDKSFQVNMEHPTSPYYHCAAEGLGERMNFQREERRWGEACALVSLWGEQGVLGDQGPGHCPSHV